MKTPNAIHTTGSARSGFTVLELLVATAITAVLAAMLIGITTGVMAVWNRSRGTLTTGNQVKFALDQLALDLEGAIMRHDGGVWLAATILDTNNPAQSENSATLRDRRDWLVFGPGSSQIKPPSVPGVASPSFNVSMSDIEACRFGRAGVWLRFFSTKQDSNDDLDELSAPSAVSYQFRRARVSNSNSEILYMLYRSVVRPEPGPGTFSAGFDLDPSGPSGSGTYNTASPTSGYPGNVLRPTVAQLLANNVVDFGVRLYVREGPNLRLIFPARPAALGASPAIGEPSDSSTTVPPAELSHLARATASVVATDAYRNRMPDVVEVMLRVLTDEGAQLIQALEAGQSSGDWWTIAEAHSRVYTRRIEILGKPL